MNVALRSNLNLISLCSGGGGLDLGFELAVPSARSVVLMEREAFAVSQLVSAIEQGLMAPAAVWSDVTTFNGRPWRGIVDGVIGGIPCQPHSLAGKRHGSDDERDLWSDARRIIVQSGAWFVLIENVSGMLSAKPGLDPGALRVRRDLSRLGFDVEGGLFTAAEVGASHERERVFILAVADRVSDRSSAGLSASSRWHGIGAEPAVAEHDCDDLADAGCGSKQRWGRAGDVLRASGRGEGEGDQWQRNGYAAGDSREGLPGVGQADPNGERLEGLRADLGAQGRPDAWRPAGLRDRAVMVLAEGERRREGRPEPEFRSGRDAFAGASRAMGDALSGGHHGRSDDEVGRSIKRAAAQGTSQYAGLSPPSPSDLSSWKGVLESAPELEPAFRRVADGLASRLDIARVDRLRMLGNGVVPLQAAYAVRTLAARLAASGSSGAARLVRLMELAA